MKAFKKMTAAQKRVAIAKDVLSRLTRKRGHITVRENYRYLRPEDSTVTTINQKTAVSQCCTVCAAGSIVLSGIGLFNQFAVTVRADIGAVERSSVHNRWFSLRQMALIEAAFEINSTSGLCRDAGIDWTREAEKATAFCAGYADPTKRFRAIFRNIIANKGTFIP